MNDVAMCFAALEVIAKEAPSKAGRSEEIRTRMRDLGLEHDPIKRKHIWH